MQLYLIRHCQSENNALWQRTGSSKGRHEDPDLTEIGHQQAQLLAQYLVTKRSNFSENGRDRQNRSGFELTHLYCSLMRRSILTGRYISELAELPLVAWTDIHERGGIYQHDHEADERIGLPGLGRRHLLEIHPVLVLPGDLDETGWWNRPYEDAVAALKRAETVVEELLQRHGGTDARVAFITHGGFFQSLMSVLFGFSPLDDDVEVWAAMNNASITRIDLHEEAVVLAYQNRVDFLPAELVT